MARCRALFLLGALAFAAFVNSAVQSFVGTPGSVSSRLRATPAVEADQRQVEVAMRFFGGSVAPTPPTPKVVEDPNVYIIGISLLMIASVFANTSGFFGPWAK
mmetsp:Transcript_65235/g.212478  ORF Transcript_65235/g.212478 Transcript_65235/m.212478 type:complete len:103 (+) Transcript_65235:2-310(+)